MNTEDLKTTLEQHALWLVNNGGQRADLSGAVLNDADLRGANLRSANLSGANLRGAVLNDADLSGANLRGAYLRHANLRHANLYGAVLNDADLCGANLRGAVLNDADLSAAHLSAAHLSEVRGIKVAACNWSSHGERGRQLSAVLLPDGLHFYCGCFSGSEQALRDYISKGRVEYRASRTKALDFLLSCF